MFQTKNPLAVISAFKHQAVVLKPNCVSIKMAASNCLDRAYMEPHAPTWAKRVEGLKQAHELGIYTIFRCAPFFIGEPEFKVLEQMVEDIKKYTTVLVVEPFRFTKIGLATGYNHDVFSGTSWKTAEAFQEANGAKVVPTYRPLRWFRYDRDIIRGWYLRVKKLANKHGLKFGTCSDEYLSFPHADLNDLACCCCDGKDGKPFGYDRNAICVRTKENRMGELALPILKEMEPESHMWYLEAYRAMLANNRKLLL